MEEGDDEEVEAAVVDTGSMTKEVMDVDAVAAGDDVSKSSGTIVLVEVEALILSSIDGTWVGRKCVRVSSSISTRCLTAAVLPPHIDCRATTTAGGEEED